MKLGIFAPGPPPGRPVVLVEPAVQATHDRGLTAVRRARLAATYPRPADFRRALRAVLGAPS